MEFSCKILLPCSHLSTARSNIRIETFPNDVDSVQLYIKPRWLVLSAGQNMFLQALRALFQVNIATLCIIIIHVLAKQLYINNAELSLEVDPVCL